MQKVEDELRARDATMPGTRGAHFVSALCVAWPDGHVEEFEARVDGTLVWPPRGTAGFGYDPVFLPDGFDRTFGEMTSEEKHGLPPHGLGLSHRARAFLKLAEACLPEPRRVDRLRTGIRQGSDHARSGHIRADADSRARLRRRWPLPRCSLPSG